MTHYRVAGRNQPVERDEEPADVVEAQFRGRFPEHVQRTTRVTAGELSAQIDAFDSVALAGVGAASLDVEVEATLVTGVQRASGVVGSRIRTRWQTCW